MRARQRARQGLTCTPDHFTAHSNRAATLLSLRPWTAIAAFAAEPASAAAAAPAPAAALVTALARFALRITAFAAEAALAATTASAAMSALAATSVAFAPEVTTRATARAFRGGLAAAEKTFQPPDKAAGRLFRFGLGPPLLMGLAILMGLLRSRFPAAVVASRTALVAAFPGLAGFERPALAVLARFA